MVKVFYLVYGLTSGGIEKYSVNLYKHLDHEKYDFQFIVKKNEHEFFDDEFKNAGGQKIALGNVNDRSKIRYRLNYLIKLLSVIREDKYDIAYFNLSTPSDVFKYPLICKIFGIKRIIIHSHNSNQGSINFFTRLVNKMGRAYINKIATARFACSDKAAAWMFGRACKSYTLVNNGLEINKYDFNRLMREKIRNKLSINDKQFIVGHVGRFVRQKNHKFLLEIFKEFLKKKPNAILLLIGVGTLMSEVQKQARILGIKDKIIFLGEKDNVNEYMQAMDVFVLPSLYEGLPIAGIEAQATGLKCVFSDTISSEADITGNVVFKALGSSPGSWAEAINDCTKNVMRTSTSDKVQRAGFDIQYVTREVEATIDKLMKSK